MSSSSSVSSSVHITLRGVVHRLICGQDQVPRVRALAAELELSLRLLAEQAPHASDTLLLMMHALMLQDRLSSADSPSLEGAEQAGALEDPRVSHLTEGAHGAAQPTQLILSSAEQQAVAHAMAAVTDYVQGLLDRYRLSPEAEESPRTECSPCI